MTERTELVDALNIAFSQKYHSMAQYVAGAEPYVKPGREGLLAVVNDLAELDKRAAEQLAEAIERIGGIAQPGTADPQLSAYHFLDLDFLANALADTLERQKSYYEGMRQRFGGDEEAEANFAMLTAIATEQLDRLKKAIIA